MSTPQQPEIANFSLQYQISQFKCQSNFKKGINSFDRSLGGGYEEV
jgi:hypothetical protein